MIGDAACDQELKYNHPFLQIPPYRNGMNEKAVE